MSNLPITKYRALDSNGDPLNAGELYFYEAGTTTPYDTYSDEALATPNANPVVADSAGLFGEIYLDPDQAYKIVLKDSDGNTIYTVDDIYANNLSSTSVVTRIKQIASNPLDYGAVGDGVADEYSEVQDAIDNATGVVDLLGKTFKCNTAIQPTSNLIIRNGTLDFSALVGDSALQLVGTLGDPVGVSGNIAAGDLDFDVDSVSGLSVGDYLLLQDSTTFISSVDRAEIVQIIDITSTTLSVSSPLNSAYTTAASASVRKLTPIQGVVLEDLTIIMNASGGDIGVNADYCADLRISRCNFNDNGGGNTALRIRSCANVNIDDCRFYGDALAASATYISIGGANRDVVISDSLLEYGQYGIVTEEHGTVGPNRNISITNTKFNLCDRPMYFTYAEGIQVMGCRVDGTAASADDRNGIECEGYDISVNDCVFNICEDNAIHVAPKIPSYETGYIHIDSNQILDPTTGPAILIESQTTGTGDIESIQISNNTIRAGSIDVELANSSASAINRCLIDGNNIEAAEITCIGVSSGEIDNVSVINNMCSNIDLDYCDDARVAGNQISSAIAILIDATNCDRCNITNNHAYGTTGVTTGINYSGTDCYIAGNHVDTSAASGTQGVLLANAAAIVGNYIKASGKGIAFADGNISGCTISSNYVSSAGNGIHYNGTGSNNMDTTTIAGNTINVNDGDGIYINCASPGNGYLVISGNTIVLAADGAGDNCIHLDGYCSGVTINGNQLNRSSDNDDNILLDGAAAAAINGVAITGNYMAQGDYAVGEPTDANNTNITVAGNVTYSMATGAFEGTVTSVVGGAGDNNLNF